MKYPTLKKHLFLFAILSLSVFVAACGGNKSADEATQDGELTDTMHNAQTPPSFLGIYSGILPCGNCAGIQTVIHLLADSIYTKRFIYLGRGTDEVLLEEGKYSWNKEGSVITLQGPSSSIQYIVGENKIIQLNENGQQYQGSDAGQYVLNRTELMTPTPVQAE